MTGFFLLYKMLSDNTMTIIEGICLAIDSRNLPESYCYELIGYANQINNEALAYLLWLLNRWTLLRLNEYHLPKRIN
jgi:hypothetical protein